MQGGRMLGWKGKGTLEVRLDYLGLKELHLSMLLGLRKICIGIIIIAFLAVRSFSLFLSNF